MFTANPDTERKVKLIATVENVDRQFEKMLSAKTSSLGRGGMISKVRAAKHAVNAGTETYIADGRQSGTISKIISGASVGTRFVAKHHGPMSPQQIWLMSAKGFGQIIIDDGAVAALCNGKSLLFPGIVKAKGLFEKNQIVEVISRLGQPVAYGKVNYGYLDINKALGERKVKGPKNPFDKEVVHRNYMAVLNL